MGLFTLHKYQVTTTIRKRIQDVSACFKNATKMIKYFIVTYKCTGITAITKIQLRKSNLYLDESFNDIQLHYT